MVTLESGCEFLGCTSQVREDRCGGGETEQIPYNSYITVFQQIFCKRIFWMNFKLQEVHLVAQRTVQKIWKKRKEMNIVSADI